MFMKGTYLAKCLKRLTRNFHSEYVEKSINQVTLLGRVGSDPTIRNPETNSYVFLTLATNTNIRNDNSESFQQKTEWHKIIFFKHHLKDKVINYCKKGHRILVQGKIVYGEVIDSNGIHRQTTTIVGNDVIFLNSNEKIDSSLNTENEKNEDE